MIFDSSQVLQLVGILELETNSIQSAAGTLGRALEFAEDGISLMGLGATAESIGMTGDRHSAQEAVCMYTRGANMLQRDRMDVPLEIWNNIGVLHLEMGQILEATYSLSLAMLTCDNAALQHPSPNVEGVVWESGGVKQRDLESVSTVRANLIGVYIRAGCTAAALELAGSCFNINDTSNSCELLTSARLAMKLNDCMTVRSQTSIALPGIHHSLTRDCANSVRGPAVAVSQTTKTSALVASSLLSHIGDFHLALALVQKLHAADCLTESYRAQCYLHFHEAARGTRDADISRSLYCSSECARLALRLAPDCAAVR